MGGRGRSLSHSAHQAVNRRKERNLMKAKAAKRENLIKELEKNKVRHTKGDIIMITRDQEGKITFLEKGNSRAGLEHINKHAPQFKAAWNINKKDIPSFIQHVIEKGRCISTVKDKEGTRKKFHYKGHNLVVIITGSNGFIVTAHPGKEKGTK